MEQAQARQRAKELYGIAVEARKKPDGGWLLGGWPNQKDATWIVVSPNKKVVLDDGENKEEQ